MAGGCNLNEDEIWNYKSVRRIKDTKICHQNKISREKSNVTSLKKLFHDKNSKQSIKKTNIHHETPLKSTSDDPISLKEFDTHGTRQCQFPTKVIDVELLSYEECDSGNIKFQLKDLIGSVEQKGNKQNCTNLTVSNKKDSLKKFIERKSRKSEKNRMKTPEKNKLKNSPNKSPSSSQNSNSSHSHLSVNCHCIEEYFSSPSRNSKRKSSDSTLGETSTTEGEMVIKKCKAEKKDKTEFHSDSLAIKELNYDTHEASPIQNSNVNVKNITALDYITDVDIETENEDRIGQQDVLKLCSSYKADQSDQLICETDSLDNNPDGFFIDSDTDSLSVIDKTDANHLVEATDLKRDNNTCSSIGKSAQLSADLVKSNNPAINKQMSLYSFFKPKYGLKEKSMNAMKSDLSTANKNVFWNISSRKDLHTQKKDSLSKADITSPGFPELCSSRLSSEVNPTGKKVCPFYKKIPGTAITVDAFRYGVIPDCQAYILTHFHYDHYGGLTKKFTQPIYCSQVTGNLVEHRLGIDNKWINRLPLWQPCQIAGITLTLMEANHCPGAVIILFEIPGGKKILHTGDFRACIEMEQYKMLQNVTISELYLDTTYCDPSYAFPPQIEVIEFVVELVLNHVTEKPNTLIVCGAYTIGKERIFQAIANVLDSKICVLRDKKKVLDCLDDEDLKSRLTLDWSKGQVHVLPMGKLNQSALSEHHSKYPQFDSIIAFQPTGWTHQEKLDSLQNLKPKWSMKNITLYGVPYSEHSSFLELKHFVQFLKPRKIIPTVNNGNPSSRQKMEDIFKQWMQK
ncbi:DNA cross-link repair 1A protein [Bulinus truncatus]|nr:DNA cross-link repair 1A protein [Bulinus truncatus]